MTKEMKSEQRKFIINIPRPEGIKDKAETFTINGKNYQVMYDADVEVPEAVYEVYQNSKQAKAIANQTSDKYLGVDHMIANT